MSTVERAVEIARLAHQGQTDKRGGPYLDHVLRVAARLGDDPEAETVALLHDVIEKGPGWTLDRLSAEGFSAAILAAVDALSRQDGEADAHFIDRAARDPLARRVKRADLLDNLESARRFMSSDEAAEKTGRYEADLRHLDG